MSQQERAVRTRNQLLLTAAASFQRRGFSRTSLTEVSRRAGVSSGALYFHFTSKEALAAAVEAEAARMLQAAARRTYRSRSSPMQTLIDTSHALVSLLRSDIVTQAGFQLNCDGHARSRTDLRQEWHGCIQRLLAEAGRGGALLPTASRQAAASVIVSATIGFDVLGREDEQWISAGSVTALWDLLLPGLVTPDERARLSPSEPPAVSPPDAELPMQQVPRPQQPDE